ncbi:hypothetical protein [Streptomyces sp. NPDC102283]|uniref:hypothetical protein n=1 Tax=Streptomyces sp. NPDC102283 TaxID=3366155 RepID=UPI003828B8FD
MTTSERRPGEPRVQCVCDCGKPHSVLLQMWGRTQSCGCLRTEQLVARSTTHGHSGSSVYMTWGDMVNRCTNATHKRWADYGGRGITVCERWRKFDNFLADMGERPEGMTLDRIDNDRGYELGNCRWVSQSEQNRNRRPAAYAGSAHDAKTGRFVSKAVPDVA